ncbi:DUF3820 family protein [bacterium]|nr:DUF3820 family protein [bacterium]
MDTPNLFPQMPDPEIMISLVRDKMPFGKYAGRLLCDLPVFYLEWFQREGFPKGKLGMQLATLYEIKTNGLDEILWKLKGMK